MLGPVIKSPSPLRDFALAGGEITVRFSLPQEGGGYVYVTKQLKLNDPKNAILYTSASVDNLFRSCAQEILSQEEEE